MKLLKDRPPYWAGVLAVCLGLGSGIFILVVMIADQDSLGEIVRPDRLPIPMPAWVWYSVGLVLAGALAASGAAAIAKRRRQG